MAKQRIKILHLLNSLNPGGAETNLLELLPHFYKGQYEHAIACGGGGALETEFSDAGASLIPLSRKPLSLSSLCMLRSMVRHVCAYKPDIIHSHLDLPNLVGLASKRKLGCKLVLHFHGNGIIPYRQLAGRALNHWVWGILKYAYKGCDKAIAICNYQLPFLERIGIRDSQVTLIPNGITLGKRPAVSRPADNGYQFVNVARFHAFKNHALLIHAFKLVSQNNPHVRLKLVGDGPLLPSIRHLVQKAGLADKVIFLGMRRDVPEILAASHCFVLSSKWELLPVTILEAMRAGLPVIATHVGGVPDIITENVSGYLVRSGDINGLADAMSNLASQPDKGFKMGVRGRDVIYGRFSNALVARKIEAVYLNLLN